MVPTAGQACKSELVVKSIKEAVEPTPQASALYRAILFGDFIVVTQPRYTHARARARADLVVARVGHPDRDRHRPRILGRKKVNDKENKREEKNKKEQAIQNFEEKLFDSFFETITIALAPQSESGFRRHF